MKKTNHLERAMSSLQNAGKRFKDFCFTGGNSDHQRIAVDLVEAGVFLKDHQETPNFTYSAEILKVRDGDTLLARLDLGFSCFSNQWLRVARINTSEMKSKDPVQLERAQAAKAYVETLLGRQVVIQSKKTDIYGRYIAEVLFDGKNLSDALVEAKLADVYTGGKVARE